MVSLRDRRYAVSLHENDGSKAASDGLTVLPSTLFCVPETAEPALVGEAPQPAREPFSISDAPRLSVKRSRHPVWDECPAAERQQLRVAAVERAVQATPPLPVPLRERHRSYQMARAARFRALLEKGAQGQESLAQVTPTPSHLLGRISPIFPPFFPAFCAFSPS